MKKLLLFSLLFFFFSNSLFSQEENKEEYRSEIGMNAAYLVTNLLRNEQQITNLFGRNYLFTYKSIKGKSAFRTGLGFDISNAKNESTSPDPDAETNTRRIDYRIGGERQMLIEKGWQLNAGIDLAIMSFKQTLPFNIDETTNVLQVGLVPFLGIQFNINSKIHLSTETSFGFYYSDQKNVFLTNGVIFVQNLSDQKVTSSRFQLPQELILSIAF